jgi:translation initiation factor IF-1
MKPFFRPILSANTPKSSCPVMAPARAAECGCMRKDEIHFEEGDSVPVEMEAEKVALSL